ncbi:hypothetical protein ACP70R_002763 [Stipagrostis hirtigluma subsp. patula]
MAAVGVAVSVSMGVMKPVLDKLTTLMGDKYKILKGLRKEVFFLREELGTINALLQKMDDADELDPLAKNWRNHVIEMSYDIEDCIDDFMHCVGEASDKVGILRKASRYLRTFKDRYRIANQIEKIKANVIRASERRVRYKLDECISSTRSVVVDPRLSAIYTDSATLVGTDTQKEQLIKWVTDEEQQLKVISVVGFGGLGKTTLANEVYREVGVQFEWKAFVSISQKPNMTSLLNSLLLQLELPPYSHACEVHDLLNRLRGHLQNKRYFIIVDDLWDVSTWNFINCAFPENDRQSRVIVTTRDANVAVACSSQNGCIHNMKPLSEQDSRKLFFTRIFRSQDGCPPQFMEASCEILKKCGGLPLAIISVASILACQPTMLTEHWQHIQNFLATRSAMNPTLEDMMHILDLSFRSLPSQLKTCFLYLGTYPEDHGIERNDLVRRWVAEGFICPPVGVDAWYVAESYFKQLVDRSMIQPEHTYYFVTKKYYKVHDMMLDLIRSKCRENNFVSMVHDPQATAELQDKVRRLTMHSSAKHDTTDVIISRQLAQVRSLAIFGAQSMPLLSHLKCLRVVFLLGFAWHVMRIDLKWIIELPQLRYLGVADRSWRTDCCVVLPSQIRSMRHLETLEILCSPVLSIPPDIFYLPRLSHLIVPECLILPDGIGKVKLLRTLTRFRLPTGSLEIIKDIGELTNLEVLDLACYTVRGGTRGFIPMPMTWMAAWSSALQKLSNLRELCVNSYHFSCCADALSSWILPPFPMLEVLDVEGWTFSRVPRWMGDLLELHTLKFGVKEMSNLTWADVGILGKLPCLTILDLRIEGGVPAEGIVIGGATGFGALHCFDLQIKSTSYLKFEAGAMPKLQDLRLKVDPYECDNGTTSVGLEHLSSLREIVVFAHCINPLSPEAEAKYDAFCAMFQEAVNALPSQPAFRPSYVCFAYSDCHGTRTPVEALQMLKAHDADLDRTGKMTQNTYKPSDRCPVLPPQVSEDALTEGAFERAAGSLVGKFATYVKFRYFCTG